MKRCSYFIPEKALFGSFPTQENVFKLEEMGVRHFIDLTIHNEHNIIPYQTKYNYIKHPISDREIPRNWVSFSVFIVKICSIIDKLQNNEKIYIHCKGGHGRSGIVVASILCYYLKISPEEALHKTREYHSHRIEMRDKWRKIGSPQTFKQKNFVRRLFEPLIYGSSMYSTFTFGFRNSSFYPVQTELGYFKTAKDAIKEHKNTTENWNEKKTEVLTMILKEKFQQHENLRKNLLRTCLRPLIKIGTDNFWGVIQKDNKLIGLNEHGKILQKIREEIFLSFST